jgi:hypothetical protein
LTGSDDAGGPKIPSVGGFRLQGAARRLLLSAAGRIRAHPGVAVAALINLGLLFLPFYDPNNIPLALASVAHFNSSGPVFTYTGWVAGPFIYAMYVPAALAYIGSGFSLYWTYTTYKVLFFALTVWMAYALHGVFRSRSPALSEGVVIFTLVNPIWLFVNYVWVEYDIFPVAFLAVGYIVLRHCPRSIPDRWRIPMGVGLISISVFFYWIALAILPVLVVYSKSARERLRLVFAMVGMIGSLFVLSIVLFGDDFGLFSNALVGQITTLNRSTFFGVQHFFTIPAIDYLAFLFVLGVAVPPVLRKLHFTEPAAAMIILSVFLVTSTIPTPDNFVFVFPFAALALLHRAPKRFRYGYFFGLLAYPIVGLLLVNAIISNAQPDGVGVYYWGYDLFHSDVHFFRTSDQLASFLTFFNLASIAAIGFSIALLVRLSRLPVNASRDSNLDPDLESPVPQERLRGIRPHPRWGRGLMAGAVALLAGGSLLFNSAVPNLVQYDGAGTAPIYFLLPQFVPDNGNVVRPLAGVTFAADGGTVQIPRAAVPLQFVRWLGPESLNFSATAHFPGVYPRNATIVQGTPFSIAIANSTEPDARTASLLPPAGPSTPPNSTASRLLLNRTSSVFLLNGRASMTYTMDSSSSTDQYLVFAFDLTSQGALQTNIFHLDGTFGYVALVSYPQYTLLVTRGPSNSNVVIPGVIPLNTWCFLEFSLRSSIFWLDVNGEIATAANPFFGPVPIDLVLGVPPFPEGPQDAFTGFVTGLYSSPRPLPLPVNFSYLVENGGRSASAPLPGPALSFSLQSNLTESRLVVNNRSYSASSQTTLFGIGKYVNSNYGVSFTIDHFSMVQLRENRYYLVPVFLAFVLPFALVPTSTRILRHRSPVGPTWAPFQESESKPIPHRPAHP